MTDRETTKRMFTHMINMMEQHDTMTISCGEPLVELLKDVRELLKEQDETIKELQNAYGYLQKQFFEIQGKLLKEQEAVKPEKEHSRSGTTWWNVCGNCKTAINPNNKYCHECGRAVKWI